MNVLLTGASGFIGRNLAAALNHAGHQIRPAMRGNGFDFRRLLAPADWLPHLRGIDAVINCVGIIGENTGQKFRPLHAEAPAALFHACVMVGIQRAIQISALGADDTAFSAFHLSKRTADDCLRGLDLDWFVLRPSLIYGRGGGSAEQLLRLAAWPLLPVLDDGRQMLQPVHIGDVVATVMRCLTATNARQTLDIIGPETFTFVDWLQRIRAAHGLGRAPVLRIPFRLTLALTWLGQGFSPMLRTDNLRMLKIGYRAKVEPLAEFLGRMPLAAESRLFFSDAIEPGSAT
ncbi:MAG: NAD(P)H-binding protein [Betaproteobacteria bacterium]|nr:NAD(P)H-binding protein [Betaproteobacteria bacterium]